jgi:hypothetical protein
LNWQFVWDLWIKIFLLARNIHSKCQLFRTKFAFAPIREGQFNMESSKNCYCSNISECLTHQYWNFQFIFLIHDFCAESICYRFPFEVCTILDLLYLFIRCLTFGLNHFFQRNCYSIFEKVLMNFDCFERKKFQLYY